LLAKKTCLPDRLAYAVHSKSAMDDLRPGYNVSSTARWNSAQPWGSDQLFTQTLSSTDVVLRKAGAPLDNNICERALKKRFCTGRFVFS
jgi:hypothetical protein